MTTAKDAGKPYTEAENTFGRKTGRHSHPATHPNWMEFTDGNCIVWGTTQEAARG
jgi:hypothetical protein